MPAGLGLGLGLGLAAVLALTGCASGMAEPLPSSSPRAEASGAPSSPAPPAMPSPGSPSPSPASPAPAPAFGIGAEPARVSVPAIELDEPLIGLGIASTGAMEVPVDADEVGWFTGGGRPGGRGPTVIAAHVDSTTGPAVFFRLSELVAGDEVTVTTVEDAAVRYVVDEVVDVPKAEFPTARVFGAQPTDQLRLITCGGVFDPGSGHYDQNRVVFASPAA
ncbi:class F sortase [Frigoribacterium sp. PvP032]|uniref:class F sortase n=1 Tax=Frigoribacterium sp. PvP032 TaxID=2806589 RepID=UPI0027DC3AED|nr:class F sortase [Frigoribacterium sp. PvP032]